MDKRKISGQVTTEREEIICCHMKVKNWIDEKYHNNTVYNNWVASNTIVERKYLGLIGMNIDNRIDECDTLGFPTVPK